jgi:hypothetical protein
MTMALIAGGLQAGLSIIGGRRAKESGAELAMLNLERLEKRYEENIEMIDKVYQDNLQKTMYENTVQRFNYVENTTDQLGKVVSDIAVVSEGADVAASSYGGQTITENNETFARNVNNLILEEAADVQSLANTKYNQSILQANSFENSATRLSNQLKRTERTANNMMLSGTIKGLSTIGMGYAQNASFGSDATSGSGTDYLTLTPTDELYDTYLSPTKDTGDELYDKYFKPTWGWQ